MRIFVTGANGFIGSAIVQELLAGGYQVLGLSRSDEGAQSLKAAGAEALIGDVEDLESLSRGVAMAEGVIHTAFNHDFSKFVENCESDRKVIEAIGAALEGAGHPLVIASPTATVNIAPGEPAREDNPIPSSKVFPRAATEEAAASAMARGVNVSIVRLSQVHDETKQGLVSEVIKLAREKKVSAYVGDGGNAWSAVHRRDAAHLFKLALDKREPGSHYHAVAEEGIAFRAIAEAVGRGLKTPVRALPADEAAAHFGWLMKFAGRDLRASSEKTQRQLNWHPTGPSLLEDLASMNYSKG